MLYRMYQRYCSSKDFKIEVLDYLDGDVAGIKSVTFLVKGKYAYGHLKAEKVFIDLLEYLHLILPKDVILHLHPLMLFLN